MSGLLAFATHLIGTFNFMKHLRITRLRDLLSSVTCGLTDIGYCDVLSDAGVKTQHVVFNFVEMPILAVIENMYLYATVIT